MISEGDLKFNCCESTLLRVNNVHCLYGFDSDVMRIASNFGGGVGGWGSVCGAVSGSGMALGLLYGTEGVERLEDFLEKREKLRALTQEFMISFEEEFESVNCMDLLGVDRRTEEGKKRYEELKAKEETHCEEYVEWAANKIIEMINSIS